MKFLKTDIAHFGIEATNNSLIASVIEFILMGLTRFKIFAIFHVLKLKCAWSVHGVIPSSANHQVYVPAYRST